MNIINIALVLFTIMGIVAPSDNGLIINVINVDIREGRIYLDIANTSDSDVKIMDIIYPNSTIILSDSINRYLWKGDEGEHIDSFGFQYPIYIESKHRVIAKCICVGTWNAYIKKGGKYEIYEISNIQRGKYRYIAKISTYYVKMSSGKIEALIAEVNGYCHVK